MTHERIYLDPTDDRVWIDTYLLDLCVQPHPAILIMPGGAYCSICDDREGEPIALAFAAMGYHAFVLHYRVGREGDVYPCQLTDAARAMLYIRQHAEALRLDPARVYAAGFSAGGHLCGCLATVDRDPALLAALGTTAETVRPTAVALAYPVVTLRGDTHLPTFLHLLGRAEPTFTEQERQCLSLESRLGEATAPMYLWHTAEDEAVPPVGTLRLAEALLRAHIPMQLSIFPYGPHGVALANTVTARSPLSTGGDVQPAAQGWVGAADAFFKSLKSRSCS